MKFKDFIKFFRILFFTRIFSFLLTLESIALVKKNLSEAPLKIILKDSISEVFSFLIDSYPEINL